MIARLLRSTDFERVLRTRSRVSSAHFALHHVPGRPATFVRRAVNASVKPASDELSTGETTVLRHLVDDLQSNAPQTPPETAVALPSDAVWLGTVVPKRHARRAVTRTLLKRQIHNAAGGQGGSLGAGLWVVRLRAPFDVRVFVSAASDALKRAARAELDGLFAAAASRRTSGR